MIIDKVQNLYRLLLPLKPANANTPADDDEDDVTVTTTIWRLAVGIKSAQIIG